MPPKTIKRTRATSSSHHRPSKRQRVSKAAAAPAPPAVARAKALFRQWWPQAKSRQRPLAELRTSNWPRPQNDRCPLTLEAEAAVTVSFRLLSKKGSKTLPRVLKRGPRNSHNVPKDPPRDPQRTAERPHL